MGRLIMIGGGERSGKSRYALLRADAYHPERVFVATAEESDAEMQARIAQHREERGHRYRTIEAPLRVPDALESVGAASIVVVDCLTLWISNLLLADFEPSEILVQVERLRQVSGSLAADVIVVTNEVGLGLVAMSALGRRFQDVIGRAHQLLAEAAAELHFGMLGSILRLRPDPVALVYPEPRS